LNELKERVHFLTLAKIMTAANIGLPTALAKWFNIADLQCLVYSVLGHCHNQNCQCDHLNVWNQQAERIYQDILLGIQALSCCEPGLWQWLEPAPTSHPQPLHTSHSTY
jgi:hypothetical protein